MQCRYVQDFSKYSFCQSLYILSKINNISFDKLRDLKLSNREIKKIKEYEKINMEFLDNLTLELILYKYDKDDIYFIVDYFDYCDKKDIDIIDLPISSFNDIAITSTEIISIVDKSPGPWIKEVTKKLEEAILLNKINNTEKNILDFLKKIRDNI